MKRTLIEFYDPNFLENIVALFGAEYDRVIYLYLEESRIPDQKDRDRLTRFVRNRLGFEPEFRGVPASSAESLLRCFGEIVQTGGRFDFDITGGIPMFIAAAGLFAASCPEKPVFLIQFAPGQGKLVFCYPEGRPHEPSPTPVIDLTIPEVIQLSGASFLKDHGPARYELEKSGLRREILRLWDAVGTSIGGWNAFCALRSPEGLPHGMSGKSVDLRRAQVYETIAGKLRRAGILAGERRKKVGGKLLAAYQLRVPKQAQFLYDKGGNLLEMLAYLAAKDTGSFADICCGAMLDWDGHQGHGFHEPCNEIDLIFTYGHIPVFVSCKGTVVEKEYLYEISTMAKHFGGRRAKPVLISAVRNRRSIHNRAKEMGILLLDDVCTTGAAGLTEKLKKYFPPRGRDEKSSGTRS